MTLVDTPSRTAADRDEAARLIALAARTVAPLWPLESPIAVNPLSGFEDLPFFDAVGTAAALFKARTMMPLALWRRLLEQGRIDRDMLARVAVDRIGGFDLAFEAIFPDVTARDLLMARLIDLPVEEDVAPRRPAPTRAELFVAKWCAAYLDQGVSPMAMPLRRMGLYAAIRDLCVHDPDFISLTGNRARAIRDAAPADPLDAVAARIASFHYDPAGKLALLRELVARLPGWSGHIRWRTDHADASVRAGAPATMTDYLALWMLVIDHDVAQPVADSLPSPDRSMLARHFRLPADAFARLDGPAHRRAAYIADLSADQLAQIFMEAAERSAEARLIADLAKARRGQPGRRAAAGEDRPDAQLLFCIDVRSEPMRRHVEAQGRYETLGYAGFFGLPVAFRAPVDTAPRPQLPVLLAPRHEVAQQPGAAEDSDLLDRYGRTRAAAGLLDSAKQTIATSFALAEAAGPVAGLMMALRNLAPGIAHRVAGPQRPELAARLSPCAHAPGSDMTLEDRIGYAAGMFQLTGLDPDALAPIVLLVGHGATTINNAYGGSLECGACGGRAGGPNARLMAAILNDPAVHAGLAGRGLAIPAGTIFLAGQHDTTTDAIWLFDRDAVPDRHRRALAVLADDLARAGEAARAERAGRMDRRPDDLVAGAFHWGEVRPEWGLSGNAAFVIGGRDLTRALDLEGRTFLHSYDWTRDEDGSALKTILTGPMIVAQWINCQYLFSTIDNDIYGAGDKTIHNIVGGFGVMRGNEGDLCVGLPRQSLFRDDGTPHHVPQRLLTVIDAPLGRVDDLVTSDPLLARLFGNGWVHLVVLDPVTGRTYRWRGPDAVRPLAGDGGSWDAGTSRH